MIDADQFAGYLLVQGLADNTVRSYRCLFNRWVDYARMHRRNPWRPDPITVRAWGSKMTGSRSLIVQARAMMGHLCRLLQVEDVSSAVPVPRQQRTPRTRALPPAKSRALAQAADKAGLPGLAVLVGLFTAARRSEIATLRWDRIDWETDELTLARPKTRDLHTVPLHPILRDRLEQRHVDGDTWVFPGRHGGHVSPTRVWEWVLDVAEQAGIGHVTPHQLRHTLITDVNDITKDLRAAQDLAGHESPAVTAGYTRVGHERMREAIAMIDYGLTA